MSNQIKYQKIFTLGGEDIDMEYKEPNKDDLIEEIKKLPAVVLRGHLDHLIEMDRESAEPRLKWKEEALNVMDSYSLIHLITFVNKRYEFEKKKGVLAKPITKHTYS